MIRLALVLAAATIFASAVNKTILTAAITASDDATGW
jgi:hypothetical protein